MRPHPISGTADTTLPPLGTLQAALRKTTETLMRELAAPSLQAPRWTDLEWRIAEAAAVMQGISALLSQRLRWRGPERWEAFLAHQTTHTSLRRERIESLLDRIDALAREASIHVIALKGAALCRLGLYPQGGRPMSDIDLLTKPADAPAACTVLAKLGYRHAGETARHQVFEPSDAASVRAFGEHIDPPVKIELHVRISESLRVRKVDITSLIPAGDGKPGLRFYSSLPAMMNHLLLHTAANMRARAMRGIQLHDIAVVGRRMSLADWDALAALDGGNRLPWWALPPLALAARYYPSAIPAHPIDAALTGCTLWLRRAMRDQILTDVSWSRLTIQAFPGIEWCGSPAEALTFIARRVFPDRAMRHALRTVATRHAYSTGTPWYGLSHGRRILRWLFATPPRVQAIYPVRVALGVQSP